jgi:hypothetical protein
LLVVEHDMHIMKLLLTHFKYFFSFFSFPLESEFGLGFDTNGIWMRNVVSFAALAPARVCEKHGKMNEKK